MGLVLLFIKDRPLYSSNGKSYFCTNKNFAPVVVVGKLSHFGVYGKVFTGKDCMVSKPHLLSFCFDGTRVAVGPSVSSLYPVHSPPFQAGIPLLQRGQPVPLLFAVARWSIAWVWPGGPRLWGGSCFATQDAETTQCVFCSSQARPSWRVGYQPADKNNNKELECCGRIKRSFSNKCNYTNVLEPCVLFNSCPRKEAFLRALLLSE